MLPLVLGSERNFLGDRLLLCGLRFGSPLFPVSKFRDLYSSLLSHCLTSYTKDLILRESGPELPVFRPKLSTFLSHFQSSDALDSPVSVAPPSQVP